MSCNGQKNSTSIFGNHSLSSIQGEEPGTFEDNINDGLESVGGKSLGRRDEVPRSVVDHDGGRPQLGLDGVHGLGHSDGVSDVQLDRQDTASDIRGYLFGSSLKYWQSSAANGNLLVMYLY